MKKFTAFIISFGVILLAASFSAPLQPALAPVIVSEAAKSTALSAPENIKAEAGGGKAVITWDAVKGADAYKVYIYDAGTKKYKAAKTVTGTKAEISGLKNGTEYKFKVAAAVKNGKKYSMGKYSAAVSVTLSGGDASAAEKKDVPKNIKMKKTTLAADKMKGIWLSYDFLPDTSLDDAEAYDPDKKTGNASPFHNVIIREKDKAVLYYNASNYDGKEWRLSADIAGNAFETAEKGSCGFEIYTYKNANYMLVGWKSADKKDNTAVFRFTKYSDIKTDPELEMLEGTWTSVDFISDINKFDPAKKSYKGSLFLKSITFNNGNAFFTQDNGSYT